MLRYLRFAGIFYFALRYKFACPRERERESSPPPSSTALVLRSCRSLVRGSNTTRHARGDTHEYERAVRARPPRRAECTSSRSHETGYSCARLYALRLVSWRATSHCPPGVAVATKTKRRARIYMHRGFVRAKRAEIVGALSHARLRSRCKSDDYSRSRKIAIFLAMHKETGGGAITKRARGTVCSCERTSVRRGRINAAVRFAIRRMDRGMCDPHRLRRIKAQAELDDYSVRR